MTFQVQRTVSASQASAARPRFSMPARAGDAPLGHGRPDGIRFFRQHDREAEESFLAAAQQRQDAVRRDASHRFARVEVVGELGALLFLAGHDRGRPLAAIPQQLAQAADELRVLGKGLHQDPARAFERRAGVGDALRRRRRTAAASRSGTSVGSCSRRSASGSRPGFARDLRLRPPLGLVRQVEIFEPRLGLGLLESTAASSGVSLPCSSMLFRIARAPLLELAQVGQPLFERAQLRVVEAAGGFLAIAGDERHGGLVVEQRDGGLDLRQRAHGVHRQYVERSRS